MINKKWNVPFSKAIDNKAGSLFSIEKIILLIGLCFFIVGVFSLVAKVNSAFLIEIPARGGTYKEGIIGTPRFINPILAASDIDKDLVNILYSGLLRKQKDGSLTTELAESYTISTDGTNYTFKIRGDALFHDGKPVTSSDVAFTIEKALDFDIKSPRKINWEGVTVSIIDDKTISFNLKQPYSPFLESTTLGILPKHLWEKVESDQFSWNEYNISPIGSGPFKIKKVKKTPEGIPFEFDLVPNDSFGSGKPYIANIIIRSYSNEQSLLNAFASGEITSMAGLSQSSLQSMQDVIQKTSITTSETTLPRIFGIFFNQNSQNIFLDKAVRTALRQAIYKEVLIDEALLSHGTPIEGPLPFFISNATSTAGSKDRAIEILEKAGWKLNDDGVREKGTKDPKKLEFTVSTVNSPELVLVAEKVAAMWRDIGVIVDIKKFDPADLNINVIRPRKYDALLFGEAIGRDLDLYAFWHSSQRNDPGLNIALYTNRSADLLLDKSRVLISATERIETLKAFENEVTTDVAAIFLFSPKYEYIYPTVVTGVDLQTIYGPEDRFNDIHTWFMTKTSVWKIFN